MSDQQKREQFTSPKGTAKWIRVNEPDTKYKDEGEYKVDLLLESKSKEAKELKKKIDDAIEVAVSEAKANKANAKHAKIIKAASVTPYRPDVDKEGNPTGFTMFRFKAIASGVSKKTGKRWTFKPRLFDAKGKPIRKEVAVWSGSVVKVSYEMSLYGITAYSPTMGAGVSLRLCAVQILELKTGTGKDAAAFGFEAEDEGYSQDDSPAFTDDQAEAGQSNDAANEDF